MSKLYVAYGSNLNKKQMEARCPGAKVYDKGKLDGYRLELRGMKDNAHFTIAKKEKSSIPVVLWEITKEHEKSLDRYEGYPNYYVKKNIEVETENNGKVEGMVYVMVDGKKLNMPSNKYMDVCVEGYCDFDFNPLLLNKTVDISKKKVESRQNKSNNKMLSEAELEKYAFSPVERLHELYELELYINAERILADMGKTNDIDMVRNMATYMFDMYVELMCKMDCCLRGLARDYAELMYEAFFRETHPEEWEEKHNTKLPYIVHTKA